MKFHAPEHDHRYETAAIKAERQDVADNPDLSAAPAQARIKYEHPHTVFVDGGESVSFERAPAQAQHSPLPWKVEHVTHQLGVYAGKIKQTLIVPDTYNPFVNPIADVTRRIGHEAIAAANAALIVRACNNAQRLADALRNIMLGLGDNWRYVTKENRKAADEALAEWNKQK